jgi:restriction system protein
LGGSATLQEIDDQVCATLEVDEDAIAVEYESGAGQVIPDRLSWARSHLKIANLLGSGGRGVWVLTDQGRQALELSEAALKELVSEEGRKRSKSRQTAQKAQTHSSEELTDTGQPDWRDLLLEVLRNIDPAAFERLCQRLLRESGFVKVEVTGRSSDGGIDGTGILQLSLMSFYVLFQCKRYKGSVGSSVVRDFRGAMMGRTDKGLIISTGTFTSEARKEATRDGAPPIDLIDGEELCSKLKDLSLGVETTLIERVEIDEEWFNSI